MMIPPTIGGIMAGVVTWPAISVRHMIAALTIAAALIATPAAAVTITPVWHGPGANPCDGQCSLSWALDEMQGHVPPALLARLRDLVRTGAPMRLHVLDGDLIEEMGEGGPHMVHAPMRARLDLPEPMMGWRVGSYIFGVIDRCQNPVLILRPLDHAAAAPITAPTYAPVTRTPIITASASGTSLGWGRVGASVAVDADDCGCSDTPGEMPPPVPLPAPFWTLMAALAGLGWLKIRARKYHD